MIRSDRSRRRAPPRMPRAPGKNAPPLSVPSERARGYLANVLMGADMFGCTLTGGKPGETISGRTGRALVARKWWGRLFAPPIDVLMWAVRAYPYPRGHCVHAILGDVGRAQAVQAEQVKAWARARLEHAVGA